MLLLNNPPPRKLPSGPWDIEGCHFIDGAIYLDVLRNKSSAVSSGYL
jgi:hypothetical protein